MRAPIKAIAVLGSGYSGSGAVFDYLAGRPDVAVPFQGREFRLLQDPGGLNDFEFAVAAGFTPNRAAVAVAAFRDLVRRMAMSRKAHPPGYGFTACCPAFESMASQFLDDVVAMEYPGMSRWHLSRVPAARSRWIALQRALHRRRRGLARDGTMTLPVDPARFRERARQFLGDLVDSSVADQKSSYAVLNQAGSFWNPVSSTGLLGDRAVVVVTRDPIDIFCELRSGGYAYPGADPDLFCGWYKNVMDRINLAEWRFPDVTHVRFERFVTDFESEKVRLDTALGLDPDVSSGYDPADSLKNVANGRRELPQDVVDRLDDELTDLRMPHGILDDATDPAGLLQVGEH